MSIVGTSTVIFDVDTRKGMAALDALAAKQAEVQKQIEASKAGVGGASSNGLDQTANGLLNVAKGFLTIQAARRGFAFVQMGAEALDVANSFDKLALSAHTTGDALLASLRTAADGTIDDLTLMKNANLALEQTQGRAAKDLPQLLTIARAAAKATGQDVDSAFQKIVSGIDKGRASSLASVGIVIDQKRAYADYAQQIGVAVAHLTKEQQQQALTNAVLNTGGDLIATVGLNADDSSVQIARAETAVKNLGETLATKIAPFAGQVAKGVANVIDKGTVTPDTEAAGTQVQGGLIKNATDFESYAKSVRESNAQIDAAFQGDPLGAFAAHRLHDLDQLNPVEFAYAQNLIRTGTAQGEALQKAKALGDVSDSLTQQTQGQSAAFQALIPKMAAVSAVSTDDAARVLAMNSAFLQGQISVDHVRVALDALANSQAIQAAQTARNEDENRRLLQSFGGLGTATDQAAVAAKAQATALAETIDKSQTSALNVKNLADAQSRLASLGKDVFGGLLSAADGADILTKEYGYAADKARDLIDQQARIAGIQNTAKALDQGSAFRHLETSGTFQTQDQLNVSVQRQVAADLARSQGILQNGTAFQKVAEQQRLYNDAVRQSGKDSAQAITAYNALVAARDSASRAGISGQAGLLQSEINLQDSLVDKLHAVQEALAQKGLKQQEINKLLREEKDLQGQLQDAALSAEASDIQNREALRTEAPQLAFLDRLARAGGDRGSQAADRARLIRISEQQRALSLNRQVADAGGVVASLSTPAQSAPPSVQAPTGQSTAGAGTLAGGVGTLNVDLLVGEDVLAAAILHNVQNGARAALRTSKATG